MLTTESRPPIYVATTEYQRLLNLAESSLGREPGADILLEELDRAITGNPDDVPMHAIRMHDRISFIHNGTLYRGYMLVYPHESNIAALRVSVLTQIGAMLLGLSPGHVMAWTSIDGRSHRLEVIDVTRDC